jgi:hypothetical protein
MSRTRTSSPNPGQTDLFAWVHEMDQERERVETTNAERARRRGYLVFAIDSSVHPDEPDYRQVFATEAKTPNEAAAKVRPLAPGRRLRTYLATGTYSDELADARWVP